MTKKEIEAEKLKKIRERMASGRIREQKAWKLVKELNSVSDEKLDSAAFINGKRSYTYRQIFRIWDQYAEVFGAVGISERKKSRAGMTGNLSVECINAFYALNMLGVSVSMLPLEESYDDEQWLDTLKEEGITDLIIAEACAWPGILRKVSRYKDDLGLRNVIILPTYVDGPYAAPVERMQAKLYSHIVKICPDVVTMDSLIEKYEASPVSPGRRAVDEAAVITHTSGTTKGIHKPIPLSDKAMNSAALNLMAHDKFKELAAVGAKPRIAATKEMTAAFSMMDMVHTPLVLGVTNVIIPMGAFNPKFHKAIKKYGISILLTSAQQFEAWMKLPQNTVFDFSSLEFVILGGSYVSPDTLKRINRFIRKHDGHTKAISGYGLSEAGGACVFPDEGREEDDSIGRPLPGVEVRILDESDNKFYRLEDGPRTGGLYISSDTISGGRIDDRVFFTPDMIDGKPYICTYDLVKVAEDGSISYAGRMNRFFANNDGIEFNAGIIETAVARQPGIEGCAVVPKYDKKIYDTIPVLYVQACTVGNGSVRTVREALMEAFSEDDKFDVSQLPKECVITDNIPYNDTGKVDVNSITKGDASGTTYTIEGICDNGELKDIRFFVKNYVQNEGMGCEEAFCFG